MHYIGCLHMLHVVGFCIALRVVQKAGSCGDFRTPPRRPLSAAQMSWPRRIPPILSLFTYHSVTHELRAAHLASQLSARTAVSAERCQKPSTKAAGKRGAPWAYRSHVLSVTASDHDINIHIRIGIAFISAASGRRGVPPEAGDIAAIADISLHG